MNKAQYNILLQFVKDNYGTSAKRIQTYAIGEFNIPVGTALIITVRFIHLAYDNGDIGITSISGGIYHIDKKVQVYQEQAEPGNSMETIKQ